MKEWIKSLKRFNVNIAGNLTLSGENVTGATTLEDQEKKSTEFLKGTTS